MKCHKLAEWIKKEAVLSAAVMLAVISMCVIPPDGGYADYLDYKTLSVLFGLMLAMAGFQKLGVFKRIGERLLNQVHNSRQVAAVLVALCFFSGMVITNDVALITFVPFALIVLRMARLEELLIPVVVLQTVAANLGSMVTPIGNPQNLYLYSISGMTPSGFLGLMLPYGAAAFVMLAVCLLFIKRREVYGCGIEMREGRVSREFFVYLFLFGMSVGVVAGITVWPALLLTALLLVWVTDRKLFRAVDYSLLLTFIGFFIFIGNMKRVPAFCEFISRLVTGNEVAAAVAASQVISNVPAAILLSGFSSDWEKLIVGTNLGGLGTLIASMASLISYKYVAREYPKLRGRYLTVFTAVNVLFLIVLLGLGI